MTSTTISCQWLLISIGTVLIIPAINLASAGITRQRGSMSLDKRGGHYQPSSSDSTSSSSSSSHIHDHQVEEGEDDFVSNNRTLPSLPLIQDGGEIMLPRGFKIIALDEDDTPIIIIPNMHHILENNSVSIHSIDIVYKLYWKCMHELGIVIGTKCVSGLQCHCNHNHI